MTVALLKLKPVKKAGSPIKGSGAASHAAHNAGVKVSHGAAGRAAYLAAERISGEQGLVTDYRGKIGVEFSEVVLPGGGTMDRERLWNSVDAHKTQRETADVAYSFIVAFPAELAEHERKQAARDLAVWIADRYQIAVDYGMHLPEVHKGSDERNFHGHYLMSARTVSAAGELGNVQRQLNHRVCQRVDLDRGRTERRPTAVKEIRGAWERIANDALERGGHSARIDMGKQINRDPRVGRVPPTSIAAKDAARELVDLARSLRERARSASERIEEIQRERRVRVSAHVVDHIGSLDAWQQDAMGQFIRAWESADRASALRRQLREIDRRNILRAASKDEDKALRAAGRERQRAAKMLGEVEAARSSLSRISPETVLDVSARKTGPRIREIARGASLARQRGGDFSREREP